MKKIIENASQSVAYMTAEIAHICKTMNKRAPGSDGEREAAEYMADVLKRDCGCETVRIESFAEHPAAFYGYFWLSALLNVLTAVGYFVHPWVSVAMGIATLLLFVIQFILYRPLIDPLFPEKNGTNVTAIRQCSGELKRRVFISGHIDAPWEFPLNYHFGGVVFEIPGAMALAGVLFYLTIDACQLMNAGAWIDQAALWGLAFIPFFAAVGLTYNPRRVVDGANDNLSGCYMGIALLRALKQSEITLEHTQVGVILTGSEEAGLRGAKAWCQAHKWDYCDVPTFIVGFDTIHDPRYLMANARDLNGTLRTDAQLCDAFMKASADVGVPCTKGWVPPFGGSTDGAAFTQGGFRAMCVTGLNHKLEDYYHTRRDSWDNLNNEGLENCFKAAARMIEIIDQGDLDIQRARL